jgi:hypothetical protein
MSDKLLTKRTRYASYYGDEIIVALPHLDQVQHVLGLAGVASNILDTSPALDLARLSVPEPDGEAPPVAVERSANTDPTDHVSTLLAYLREHFSREHAGWAPTLGKNRLIGTVQGGGGVISHGGGGSPQRTDHTLPARGTGPGRGVRIGVLDTGLAPQPWLAGGWEARYSDRLVTTDGYPAAAGHATFVTGLILSQAPAATVVVRQVLKADSDGEYVADCWTVANEIVALGRQDLDILNLSLVCYTEDGQPPLLLATAIDRLDPDLVVIAAAGNHGDLPARPRPDDEPEPYVYDELDSSKPTYPAALDDVLAVGAATRTAEPAPFTPKNKCWIDLLAVGDQVLSTFLTGKVDLGGGHLDTFTGFGRWSGSSFSAALVSGAVAAGTRPGVVSARQSLADIVRSVRSAPSTDTSVRSAPSTDTSVRPAPSTDTADCTPPFLPLDVD